MTSLFLAAARAAASSTIDYNEWMIWACIALTLIIAFGKQTLHWLIAINKRYDIIGWDEGKEIKIEWNESR